MPSALSEEALQERLNDIYWHSDTTILEIVRTTGVTRNRLYLSIRPLATEGSCAECGGALQFLNRRARLAGQAVCSACGREATPDVMVTRDSSAPAPEGSPARPDARIDERGEHPDRAPWRNERVALLGGAAALGVVLAAAATRAMK